MDHTNANSSIFVILVPYLSFSLCISFWFVFSAIFQPITTSVEKKKSIVKNVR